MTVALRVADDADNAFLCELYGSTRAAEMAAWGWSGEQREQFVRMQFTARERHYGVMYPERADRVILRDGRPIGRMIVARHPREIVLVDIALLPDEQGHGEGTTLVWGLLREARESGRLLRLHVLSSNAAAIRFYGRLDFRTIDDDGSYLLMEWQPTETGSESCLEN
jgi:ribosomal protein S18 acetylase RimI-like enzyme